MQILCFASNVCCFTNFGVRLLIEKLFWHDSKMIFLHEWIWVDLYDWRILRQVTHTLTVFYLSLIDICNVNIAIVSSNPTLLFIFRILINSSDRSNKIFQCHLNLLWPERTTILIKFLNDNFDTELLIICHQINKDTLNSLNNRILIT